ncbi:MAG TPA: hypothetical protein ENH85_05660 [Candidatus Scalindua sp.]|nr:hypothetical protein [Candidatus Scalindua sp.]
MTRQETTMVNINKVIKLRKYAQGLLFIEEIELKKHDADSQAYSYRLGKVHSLKDLEERLGDLIIQG